MKGSCLCCGLQRDIAARLVSLADVVLGATAFILTLIHLKRMYDGNDDEFCCKINYFYPQRWGRNKNKTNGDEVDFPTWLPIVVLICTGVQCVMGIALYAATVNKNRRICQLWFITTGATCLFTGFLLRIYQILVVSEFSHELEREQRQARVCSNTAIAQPIVPHQVPMQQLRIPLPKPGTEDLMDRNHDNNPGGMYQYHHQHNNNYTVSYISSAVPGTSSSSSLYAPPTPPSYVPTAGEDQPPPYHIAIRCPPAQHY